MASAALARIEYLSKAIAAERLKISVRRLMEVSEAGKLKRYWEYDPATRRKTTMFRASDVSRLVAEMTPKAIGPASEPAPPRPWLNLDESAEYSGLPASVLRDLVAGGHLPALDVGVRPGGRFRVRRADLDALEGVRITTRL
jgi:excisionase family DNA binding protein